MGIVAEVINVQRRDGAGLTILVGRRNASDGAANAGQRVLGLVAVVVVPGIPNAIHLVAQLQQRLVLLVLEELAVHVRSVVIEDKALRAKLHGHIIEAILIYLAVADENPLAEVGKVEIRVNKSVWQTLILVVVVEEDKGSVSEELIVVVIEVFVLILDGGRRVDGCSDEWQAVCYGLGLIPGSCHHPVIGLIPFAIHLLLHQMVRQRGKVEVHESEGAVLVIDNLIAPDHADVFPVLIIVGHKSTFFLLMEIGIEELEVILLVVEIVVVLVLVAGCDELAELRERLFRFQVDAIAILLVNCFASLLHSSSVGSGTREHPFHLIQGQTATYVAVEGDGGMHDV